MNNLDEIYNQALEMLKKGSSKQDVLLKFSQYQNELAPLLDISSVLLSVPKNIVPTPLMRRKYAAVPAKSFWLAWLHISKFASVSVALMMLISAFSVTAYQVSKSTPGKALFAIKKGEENLQLVLASSRDKKASLQVSIAQQRLNDAKEIFSNPGSDGQQKNAALAELSNQTASAIAEVNTVASDPKSGVSHPLLTSLENITKEQKNLLAAIKPDSQINTAASSALATLDSNTAKLSAIRQSVAISTGNQQALVNLSANSNSVTAFGEISQVSAGKITVEQITFDINGQTVIKGPAGNSLLILNLQKGDKVNVVGIKNDNALAAQQILVTNQIATSTDGGKPEVKSASTATSATTSIASIKKNSAESASTIDSSTFSSTTIVSDPNTAKGLFMFEDPTPQFGK